MTKFIMIYNNLYNIDYIISLYIDSNYVDNEIYYYFVMMHHLPLNRSISVSGRFDGNDGHKRAKEYLITLTKHMMNDRVSLIKCNDTNMEVFYKDSDYMDKVDWMLKDTNHDK